MSSPSETLMFSYCNILINYMRIHVKKFWIIFTIFLRADATAIIMSRISNVLPKGKSTSDSNLIFMKSFLYLIGSSSFITSIYLLVSSQSVLQFFNTSLVFSVEAKTKYLFPSFSLMYPSPSSRKK